MTWDVATVVVALLLTGSAGLVSPYLEYRDPQKVNKGVRLIAIICLLGGTLFSCFAAFQNDAAATKKQQALESYQDEAEKDRDKIKRLTRNNEALLRAVSSQIDIDQYKVGLKLTMIMSMFIGSSKHLEDHLDNHFAGYEERTEKLIKALETALQAKEEEAEDWKRKFEESRIAKDSSQQSSQPPATSGSGSSDGVTQTPTPMITETPDVTGTPALASDDPPTAPKPSPTPKVTHPDILVPTSTTLGMSTSGTLFDDVPGLVEEPAVGQAPEPVRVDDSASEPGFDYQKFETLFSEVEELVARSAAKRQRLKGR